MDINRGYHRESHVRKLTFYQSTGISVMNEKCGEVGYIFENGNNWNICNAVKIQEDLRYIRFCYLLGPTQEIPHPIRGLLARENSFSY